VLDGFDGERVRDGRAPRPRPRRRKFVRAVPFGEGAVARTTADQMQTVIGNVLQVVPTHAVGKNVVVDEIVAPVRIDGALGLRDAAPGDIEALLPINLVERRPVGRYLHDAERTVDHLAHGVKRRIGSVGKAAVEVSLAFDGLCHGGRPGDEEAQRHRKHLPQHASHGHECSTALRVAPARKKTSRSSRSHRCSTWVLPTRRYRDGAWPAPGSRWRRRPRDRRWRRW